LLSAPAANGTFSTLFCESFLRCLSPYHGGPTECTCLVLPQCLRPSPRVDWSASRFFPRTRFSTDEIFEAAAIPLCSGLQVCLPPRSFLPLQVSLQGSRGFYVRAERASSPSHASDMLSARLQAIGGTRTFTSQDSQHCRLLPTPFSWGFFHPCFIPVYPGAQKPPYLCQEVCRQ